MQTFSHAVLLMLGTLAMTSATTPLTGTRKDMVVASTGAGAECENTDTLTIEGSKSTLSTMDLYTTGVAHTMHDSVAATAASAKATNSPQQLGTVVVYVKDATAACIVKLTITTTCPVGSVNKHDVELGDFTKSCVPAAITTKGTSFLDRQFVGKGTSIKIVSPHGHINDYDAKVEIKDAAVLAQAQNKINSVANVLNFEEAMNLDGDMPLVQFQSGPPTAAWAAGPATGTAPRCISRKLVGKGHLVAIVHHLDFDSTAGITLTLTNHGATDEVKIPVVMQNGLSGAQKTTKGTRGFMPFYVSDATQITGFNATATFCVDVGVAAASASSTSALGFKLSFYADTNGHSTKEARKTLMDHLVAAGLPAELNTYTDATLPFDPRTGALATATDAAILCVKVVPDNGRRLLSATDLGACSGYRYVPVVSKTPSTFDMAKYFGVTEACGIVPRMTNADARRGKRSLVLMSTGESKCALLMPKNSRPLFKRDDLFAVVKKHKISKTEVQLVTGDETAAVVNSHDNQHASCKALKQDVHDLMIGSIMKKQQEKEQLTLSTKMEAESMEDEQHITGRRLLDDHDTGSGSGACTSVVQGESSFDHFAQACYDHEAGDGGCEVNDETALCQAEVEDPTCFDLVQETINDEVGAGWLTHDATINVAGECIKGDASGNAQNDAEDPCDAPFIAGQLLKCKVQAAAALFDEELSVISEIADTAVTPDAYTTKKVDKFVNSQIEITESVLKAIDYEFNGPKISQLIHSGIVTALTAATTYTGDTDITQYTTMHTTDTAWNAAGMTTAQKATVVGAATVYQTKTATMMATLLQLSLPAAEKKALASTLMPSESPFVASGVVTFSVCIKEDIFKELDITFLAATIGSEVDPKCANGGHTWNTFSDIFAMVKKGLAGTTPDLSGNTQFTMGVGGSVMLQHDYSSSNAKGDAAAATLAGLSDSNFVGSTNFTLTARYNGVQVMTMNPSVAVCKMKDATKDTALTTSLKTNSSMALCATSWQTTTPNLYDVTNMKACTCPPLEAAKPGSDNGVALNGMPIAGPKKLAKYTLNNFIVYHDVKMGMYVQISNLVCKMKTGKKAKAVKKAQAAITSTEIAQLGCGEQCSIAKTTYKESSCCAAAAAPASTRL
jgi:hypothetical protein